MLGEPAPMDPLLGAGLCLLGAEVKGVHDLGWDIST